MLILCTYSVNKLPRHHHVAEPDRHSLLPRKSVKLQSTMLQPQATWRFAWASMRSCHACSNGRDSQAVGQMHVIISLPCRYSLVPLLLMKLLKPVLGLVPFPCVCSMVQNMITASTDTSSVQENQMAICSCGRIKRFRLLRVSAWPWHRPWVVIVYFHASQTVWSSTAWFAVTSSADYTVVFASPATHFAQALHHRRLSRSSQAWR